MTNSNPQPQADGPAVVTDMHRQDRPATDENMKALIGDLAWRKLTPLQAAFAKGQLKGGNARYSEADRLAAGQEYETIFRSTERSTTDSTQALNVSRSSSIGTNNDRQARAWDQRLAIESHLTLPDRTIVYMVLGNEASPASAVRAACNDYKYTVAARFREALDNLIEAMETARRHPKIVNLSRDP